MCSVELAFAGLKVASAATSWQADRQQAANQAYADYRTRQNADQAYLNDLSKIEAERGNAAREKAVEEFRAKMKAKKDLAKAQNAGFGNALRVAQDIGSVFDQERQRMKMKKSGGGGVEQQVGGVHDGGAGGRGPHDPESRPAPGGEGRGAPLSA